VSAEIIAFVPRLDRKRESTHSPSAAFRSAPSPDDLTMDHVDASPCEYIPPPKCPGHDLKNA
jgi:hypothetical protein